MIVHINIGSNKGNRHALIEQAVALIIRRWPEARIATSTPVETPPWGFSSQHPFINMGVTAQLPSYVAPEQILGDLQAIEQAICTDPHRNPDGSYRDRYIDIDIIAIDNLIIDSPTLTVPHPRMHLRSFVLTPMKELQAEWMHPILKKTAAEMLSELKKQEKTTF